ncbi:metallophosphoesterase family protein [Georgenia sp. Z1344]|uniref:metallophosphoesterase family protein n=1 Tax=Georgenia sp. Z1344 TaxID=3416706 RepID=UPI003CED57CE
MTSDDADRARRTSSDDEKRPDDELPDDDRFRPEEDRVERSERVEEPDDERTDGDHLDGAPDYENLDEARHDDDGRAEEPVAELHARRAGELRRPMPWWAAGVVVLLVVLGSLAIGIGTAHVETTVGPHRAEVEVTIDSDITIDLGPAGDVVLASPLPAGLGVTAVIKELPADATIGTDGGLVPGLLADAESYARLMAYPEAAFAEPTRAIVTDALSRAALIATLTLAGIAAVHAGLHGAWSQSFRVVTDRPVVGFLTGTAVAVGALAVIIPATRSDSPPGVTIASFHGTPLEDATISGRLGDLLQAYGPTIRLFYDGNTEFASDAAASLEAGLEEQGRWSTGPGGEQPEGVTTAMFYTDVHCNVGAAEVVGHAADLVEADMVIDGGDTTIAGTAIEQFCVDAIESSMPEDTPYVVAAGNHDSIVTVDQMRRAGWTVLDGSIVEVGGVRIIGDTDPRITTLDQPTVQERSETWEETAERIAADSCEALADEDPVDLAVIHDAFGGRRVAWTGCVPLTLSGHIHTHVGPEVDGLGVRWVEGAAGGQGQGVPTLGAVREPAPMGQIEFDSETGEALRYRRIVLQPDSSVEVSDWTDMPANLPIPKTDVDGDELDSESRSGGPGESPSGFGDEVPSEGPPPTDEPSDGDGGETSTSGG